jgi:uncharacterized caspase-like protein
MPARPLPTVLIALLGLCLLAATALAAPAGAEGRYALVIGNSAYKSAPLKNPAKDARDMAALLGTLGFNVTLKIDAGVKDMEEAVRGFGLNLRHGGVGLFYFAGHGIQVAGSNYLVPVDAKIQSESDVRFECVDAGRVLGKMEDAGNSLNIVILDACRNNPFSRGFRSADRGLAEMRAPTGSIIAYATAPGSVASDGSGENGIYTKHLLKNMRTPGLPITDVFMRVRMGVVGETVKKQVPWESSSLTGYFYFNDASSPDQTQQPLTAEPAVSAPAPAAPARLDPKAEKKRLAEEAAQLRREKQELAQLQSLRTERESLEAERQKLEQAKLLAMSSRPKQPPASPAPAAPQANAHAVQFAQLARASLSDARAYFERTVQARPDDADARAGLAIALVFSGREADAKYQLRRVEESGALSPGVRVAKGLLLGMEGNADSQYQLNRAREEGADQALVLLCQAAIALGRNDYDGGKRLMDAFAALLSEPEQSPYARHLAGRLNPVNRVVGTYYWGTGGNVSTTYLIIERSGDGLKGTDGGGEYKSKISNVTLQGLKLSFRMEWDLGFFLGGEGSSDCVADFSNDMNRIPIACGGPKIAGAPSAYLLRKDAQKQ